jgi:hypothetical protein
MDINLGYVILAVLVIALILLFNSMAKTEVSYVKSPFDNKYYLVRNLPNKEEAAYILSIMRQKIFTFRDHLNKVKGQFPEYAPYIDQLNRRITNVVLSENSPTDTYTSYSINKGDEIVLCLRSRKNDFQLHDLNTITYVTLHELAHVACPEKDHTVLFKKIFTFFLGQAAEINIYKPVNYSMDPQEYCGMTINENLLKIK